MPKPKHRPAPRPTHTPPATPHAGATRRAHASVSPVITDANSTSATISRDARPIFTTAAPPHTPPWPKAKRKIAAQAAARAAAPTVAEYIAAREADTRAFTERLTFQGSAAAQSGSGGTGRDQTGNTNLDRATTLGTYRT
jgi:hypothetical protein